MPDTVTEGVYLCDMLDLEQLFAPTLSQLPGVRFYRPEDVPDPARIGLALAWRPRHGTFARYPALRLVQSIASGVDGILADASLPADVPVARVRNPEQAAIMAGFAAWHVVWHHRDMGQYLVNAAHARWERHSFARLVPPSQVVVGVLGHGLMGRAVAGAVAKLGFDTRAACTRPGDAEPSVTLVHGADAIHRVAASAQILINVLPLTAQTDGFIDAAFLAAMPKGAVLVHLGRGEHLCEEALLAALDSGQIRAASLDVFRAEPLPPDHPFWRHPNILVTPHEASVLPANAVAKALSMALGDLSEGRVPRTAVNRIKGY